MARKHSITEEGEIVDNVTYEPVARAPVFWKTPFNHDTDGVSLATSTLCTDPSKTQQHFLKDSDINVILAKFMQTGELPQTGAPIYGDSDDRDLMDRMVTSWDIEQAWNGLSAEVRNVLRDPKRLVEYIDHCVQNGDMEPLEKLGLAVPETLPEPKSPPGGTPAPTSADGAPQEPPAAP